MLTRLIPRTSEPLPAIGLGPWQSFDISDSPAEITPRRAVLHALLAAGGRVIDSSPMYGRSEATIGRLLATLPPGTPRPFLATKVWTRGHAAGVAQMERSLALMGTTCMDLMQVHNLLDWRTHLPVLRDWKRAGRIRYLGITHYAHSEFDALESLLHSEAVDFIQLPYNLADRAAEARLLPAAAATGTAVLVMRPLAEGGLLTRLRTRPLPAVAADLRCTSWAQLCLTFILAHPAVTCAIPASGNPAHFADDLGAARGPLPDAAACRAILAAAGL